MVSLERRALTSGKFEEAPIRIIGTAFEDFRKAKELERKLNLPWKLWDDLIIASQMKRLNIKRICSNDADFDAIGGVERMFAKVGY